MMTVIESVQPSARPVRKRRTSFVERTVTSLSDALERALFAEEIAKIDGLLQRLDPRVKVVGLLMLVVASGLARNIVVILALFALGVGLALLSRVPLRELAARAWIGTLLFTGTLALPAIFTTPGLALYHLPLLGWPITVTGVSAATYLITRVETATTFSLLLVLCTPWTHVLKALRVLRVPVVVVVLLGMTHRYIFLMLQTAREMFESRRSRTVGTLLPPDQRRLASASVGVLLTKSVQLSNDVYMAMQSRGFRGEVYMLDEFAMQVRDWAALAGFLVVRRRLSGWGGEEEKRGRLLVSWVLSFIVEVRVSDTVFDVNNIVYRYNAEVTALNDVSLTVAHGTRVAILGANGSGKSTLLRMLDGLYFPDSGSIHAFGEPLTEERLQDDAFAFRFRRRVALVFQNPDVQLFNPTVFDEVAFGPLQMRWPPDEIRRRVAEALDLLEITHLKDRAPHRLSGGEKKRVALASVLVLDPDVLLLDEPTAALDPKSQRQVIEFLAGWGNGAKTVITATHDLDTVELIADRCIVFQRGALIADDAPAVVLGDRTLLAGANLIIAGAT